MTRADEQDSLCFVGTATVLLRYAGFTILTDPNFLHRGQRAYLGHGLTSRRRTEPALRIDELPPLDLVLLSHLHGDHFDRIARRGLDRAMPIVTTRPAATRLRGRFPHTQALDCWRATTRSKGTATLRITSLPGRHARGPAQALLPAVMGSLLEFARGDGSPPYRIYITGDTVWYDGLRAISDRCPDIDLALVHLGGTRILGLLVTMDGRQGADLLELVRPRVATPIHYDDYPVFRSPLADFSAELSRRPPVARVVYLGRGETLPLPVPAP